METDSVHCGLEADLWEGYGKTTVEALQNVRKKLKSLSESQSLEQCTLEQSQRYEIQDGERCSRRFVISQPGFYVLYFQLEIVKLPGAAQDEVEDFPQETPTGAPSPRNSDGGSIALEEESADSSATMATNKRRSRREALMRRVISLAGKQKRVKTVVRVTDVHHHLVHNVSTYQQKPSFDMYFENLFGSIGTAVEDDSLCLAKGIREIGASCFMLLSNNVPAVVNVDFVSNRAAVIRTELFSEWTKALAKFTSSTQSPGTEPKHTEVGAKGRILLSSVLGDDHTVGRGLTNFGESWPNSWPAEKVEPPSSLFVGSEETASSFELRDRVNWSDLSPRGVDSPAPGHHPSDKQKQRSFSWYSGQFESSSRTLFDDDDGGEDEIETTNRTSSLDGEENNNRNRVRQRLSAKRLSSTQNGNGFHNQNQILHPLVTKGKWFHEYHGPGNPLGRAVLLRGVNLSGNAKLPTQPTSKTHIRIDWGELKNPAAAAALSFVGRPFPLEEAEEHFTRLKQWGFNCFRFLVTWEAIEHAGPGVYDVEYLNYIETVVRLAGSYGFYVFIDPHQDVWSRMTGGSGAPAWTFEAAGIDLAKIEACEAAFTHNSSDDPARFQRMSWPQNYQRFAAMHMFTLFWGGNHFAPNFVVDGGIPIQEYLQRHFINALLEVVKRVKDMPHVIGFDSFNEPSPGFIGKKLDDFPETIIPPGPVFKPFDAMCTAAGFDRVISKANSIGILTGKYRANRNRVSIWIDGVSDVWQSHGVWDVVTKRAEDGTEKIEPRLLQPNYFTRFPKGPDDGLRFFRDYLRPFMVLYISKIRSLMPRAILFAEGDGFGAREFIWDSHDPPGVVNASHWYDGYTLFTANFSTKFSIDVSTKRPVFGKSRIYAMHHRDLKAIAELPQDIEGRKIEVPTLIGEFGLPFNMNNKYGFKTGDFDMHERAISMYYDLMDALQLHSTQWNYCADNSNLWGDFWNLEDLSLFSRDQQRQHYTVDIHSGGRGTSGFCRPFAPLVCGVPLLTLFNRRSRVLEHAYEPNARNFDVGNFRHATEIFVPDCHFLSSMSPSIVQFEIIVEGGQYLKEQYPGCHIIYVWADHSRLTLKQAVHVFIKPA